MRLIRVSVALLVIAGAVAITGTQALAKGDAPKDFKAIDDDRQGEVARTATRRSSRRELEAKGEDFGKSKVKCEVGSSIDCSGTWRLDDGVLKAKGKVTPVGKSL